ncbi:MAG: SUF system Fe-S cluster assembly regulator [Gammaproteobacteria bacterium]|nr:SUF system Fe-S cluster assembly regulator [Gammaproteobacteria bacterium]
MFRISKLTDYGTLILVFLADQGDQLASASEVSAGIHVAQPTVQKLLKLLARSGFVDSVRGTEGGYKLARDPDQINAAEILDALEGPVAITECSTDAGDCALESMCQTGGAWQKINNSIRQALAEVTLTDLGHPKADFPAPDLTGDSNEPHTRTN